MRFCGLEGTLAVGGTLSGLKSCSTPGINVGLTSKFEGDTNGRGNFTVGSFKVARKEYYNALPLKQLISMQSHTPEHCWHRAERWNRSNVESVIMMLQ